MKTLSQHIDEKLLINKNYKYSDSGINNVYNDKFYEHFKKDFQWLSLHNRWDNAKHMNEISEIKTTAKYRCALNDIVQKYVQSNYIIYYYVAESPKGKDMFKRMQCWIDNYADDMTFIVNDNVGQGIYNIKIFETHEHIIGIIGNVISPLLSGNVILFIDK